MSSVASSTPVEVSPIRRRPRVDASIEKSLSLCSSVVGVLFLLVLFLLVVFLLVVFLLVQGDLPYQDDDQHHGCQSYHFVYDEYGGGVAVHGVVRAE